MARKFFKYLNKSINPLEKIDPSKIWCCNEVSLEKCFRNSMAPFSMNFLRAAIFRIAIQAVSKRSLTKILEAFTSIAPRFGVAVGLASVAFNLTMCLLRRLRNRGKIKISKPLCALLSGLAFAMPLAYGLDKTELQILKLLLYPLAFRCFVN